MPAKRTSAAGIWNGLFHYRKTAFANPDSYFHKYASLSRKDLLEFANKVWDEINLPNLEQNILPTRFRADLILEKGKNILCGDKNAENITSIFILKSL